MADRECQCFTLPKFYANLLTMLTVRNRHLCNINRKYTQKLYMILVEECNSMNKNFRRHIAGMGATALLLGGCAVPPQESTQQTQPSAVEVSITMDNQIQISENLFGIFLEDINFSVDAGLYAEMIKNRSFEYGSMAAGGAKHGWVATSSDSVTLDTIDGTADSSCLNVNNPTYAILTNSADAPEGIFNTGYLDGLAVTAGESYIASLFIRGDAQMKLSLEGKDGKVYAEAAFRAEGADWTKYSVTLTPQETVSKDLRFVVRMDKGSIHLDMISLMPPKTFAGLPIREDLGNALRDLNPSFVRFPGGCAVEGKSLESIYSWKDSIGNAIPFTINGENAVGDAATRPQTIDIWNGSNQHPYYCTYGLGFYEYFLLCEALDAMPIPILNAGMTCPVQSPRYIVYPLNSDEFKQYVQDALDLVEFCKGGGDTTWGAVRIAMGHEEPFDLKYVGIGNEQWQSEYHAHFEAFVTAFEKAAKENPQIYGGIELIVANGPSSGSTEGWAYVDDYPDSITTLVDEHYYESPSWFLTNTHRYDNYDRNAGAKVFLGEYASQSNTMNSALAEAAFMTALERNGDVVELACYAPLFGNGTLNQWLPDMIFFNRDSHYLTPNYFVQQMFSNNAGNRYLQTDVSFNASVEDNALSGKVGLGSWMTSVAYDNLKVADSAGNTLYENDFSDPATFTSDFQNHEGSWAVRDGRLIQSGTRAPADETTGDAVYVGDAVWGNYTMTVEAEILGGAEGFLIPICVQNTKNNIFWNIGGWGNTVSCLQIVTEGAKSGQITGTVRSLKLKHGQVYNLKVVVSGNNIKCYIDDVLYVDYTQESADPVYASTVLDANGDLIIKVVNVTGENLAVGVSIPGLTQYCGTDATVTVLNADTGGAVNNFQNPTKIAPAVAGMEISGDTFTIDTLPYSLTVIRIPAK